MMMRRHLHNRRTAEAIRQGDLDAVANWALARPAA